MENLEKLKKEAEIAISKASSDEVLAGIKIKWLGRKGRLTRILRSIKDLPANEKKVFGQKANLAKKEITELMRKQSKKIVLSSKKRVLGFEKIDVSLPGQKYAFGRLHPLTRVLRDIRDIFKNLGFSVIDGPEIETEWHNFDALNIPKDHPARDMWDTFWLQNSQKIPDSKKLLLRTHTSPVQIRHMKKNQPPFRIIVPGKVFRYEATDASHDIEFHQTEGLMVDANISVANFKYVINHFFQEFFGDKSLKMKLRPSYFPFTEPSFEVLLSCSNCRQKGCSVCGQTGWLEVAGAGMVHPNVFANVGLNPEFYQGFAFGFGVERLAMIKYKIPDIRLFHSSDPRFLRQF